MRHILLLFLCPLLAIGAPETTTRTISLVPVARWIEGQRDLKSISADFVQTRALKALRDPLASPGKLWFLAPDLFRWEIGEANQPAKSILLRKGKDVWLISPKKKQATRFSADAMNAQAGMRGMAMMNFPMAVSLEDFKRQFEVLDLQQSGDVCNLTVLPQDAQAKEFLQSLVISFDTRSGHLLAFEMLTKDGSSLRNAFTNVQVNAAIDRSAFDFDFTGYTVTHGK